MLTPSTPPCGLPHAVHYQLARLRTALALATATGRVLVMPPIWCELDRYWAPLEDGEWHSQQRSLIFTAPACRPHGRQHPEASTALAWRDPLRHVTLAGNIPGSRWKKPFICPMDHILDIGETGRGEGQEEAEAGCSSEAPGNEPACGEGTGAARRRTRHGYRRLPPLGADPGLALLGAPPSPADPLSFFVCFPFPSLLAERSWHNPMPEGTFGPHIEWREHSFMQVGLSEGRECCDKGGPSSRRSPRLF